MDVSHRSIQAIERDLRLHVDRRRRAHSQISQLRQAIENDARAIDRLLEERHGALATAGVATP